MTATPVALGTASTGTTGTCENCGEAIWRTPRGEWVHIRTNENSCDPENDGEGYERSR